MASNIMCNPNIWGNIYKENREKSQVITARPRADFQNYSEYDYGKVHLSVVKFDHGNSTGCGRLDWGHLVDTVFMEEIRKMAEE